MTWGIFKHDSVADAVAKVQKEGWDDMLKYVKDKNGPQPNGGSGKKQGTRYGGGKQKEDESEKRKEKNESLEETKESTVDEEVQGEIIKTGAKDIKHANVKDKLDDQEVMEPHSQGEQDFLDKHTVNVTDDPAANGSKTGADKLKHASEPKGNGAGKYDGKNKTGVKESTSEEISGEDHSTEERIDENCGSKAKGKKTFSNFKKEMKSA